MEALMEVKSAIKAVIAEEVQMSVESLHDDLLVEEMGIDSLTMAEILINIEGELNWEIDTEQAFSQPSAKTRLGELIDSIIAAKIEG